jgi:hypothetical protein
MSLKGKPQDNALDQRYVDKIEKYGYAIMSVANRVDEPTEELNFSYSTGAYESYGAPEIIISGLGADLSNRMINIFMDRWNAGEKLLTNRPYEGFLEDFSVIFLEASDESKKEKARFTDWYFESEDFPLWQLVWPGAKHRLFPWEVEDQLADVQECFLADGWPEPI